MRRPLCAACLCVILLTAAGLWLRPPEYFSFGEYSGKRVTVTGRVCAKELQRGQEAPVLLIYLKPDSILFRDIPISFEGQLLCRIRDGLEEPPVGARIRLEGILADNEPAPNPGGFDARLYYAALGVSGRLLSADITEIQNDGRSFVSNGRDRFSEAMWQCRKTLGATLDHLLPEEDAAFLKTMLLGDRSGLEEERKAIYRRAGALHILSISGLHIGLLGTGIYSLLKKCRLGQTPAAIGAGGLMLLYGEMIGMPVSACRAVFMFLFRLLAGMLGRTCDGLTSLSLCGALMALEQRLWLLQAGFQLSFMSVTALLWFRPALRIPALKPAAVGEGLAASFAVSLFTLPVQLYFYYEIPLYGLVFNLLTIPLAGIFLLLGIVLVVFGTVWPGLFCRLSREAFHWLLFCYERAAWQVGNLPCNLFTPGCPKLWQVAVFYGLVFLAVRLRGLRFRFQAGLIAGAVLLLCARTRGELVITVLDVGQGECICLEMPTGETYLIDGGSSNLADAGEDRIAPFLKCRGITKLDAVFLSHADSDHTNGVLWLLEEGETGIGALVLPDTEDQEGFAEAEALAAKREIPVLYISRGMRILNGNASFLCLHPEEDFLAEDANAGSQVLYFSYGRFSMLFTGDLQGSGEEALLRVLGEEGIAHVSVLKVAHHGSAGSTGDEFLERISPDAAVISYGKNNSYGHPSPEVTRRLRRNGCRIFGTGGGGAVIFHTDGNRLWWD